MCLKYNKIPMALDTIGVIVCIFNSGVWLDRFVCIFKNDFHSIMKQAATVTAQATERKPTVGWIKL